MKLNKKMSLGVKLICIFVFVLLSPLAVFAEKIPIKITPIQLISTDHDEIEIGDYVNFAVVDDVYQNNKLFIKKHTNIVGVVDFIHSNGWLGDSAQITFKTFYTRDVDNKKIKISSILIIDGNLKEISNWKQFVEDFAACITRGKEIDIEPDTKIYNIFIE